MKIITISQLTEGESEVKTASIFVMLEAEAEAQSKCSRIH